MPVYSSLRVIKTDQITIYSSTVVASKFIHTSTCVLLDPNSILNRLYRIIRTRFMTSCTIKRKAFRCEARLLFIYNPKIFGRLKLNIKRDLAQTSLKSCHHVFMSSVNTELKPCRVTNKSFENILFIMRHSFIPLSYVPQSPHVIRQCSFMKFSCAAPGRQCC